MVTKLRNYSRHWAVKAVSFCLFAAFVPMFVFILAHSVNDWNSSITPADHLAGRPFADSAFLARYERYYALTEETAAQLETEYAENGRFFWRCVLRLTALGLWVFIFLIHLLTVCGRKPGSDGVHLSRWDKPWLDVLLGAITGYAVLAWSGAEHMFRYGFDRSGYGPSDWDLSINIFCVLIAIFAALVLWWLLSAVKRIKDRSVLKHTLVYTVLALIFRTLRRYVGRPAIRFCRAAFNGAPLTVQIGLCSLALTGGVIFFMLAAFSSRHAAGFWMFMLFLWAAGVTAYFVWKAYHLANAAKGLSRLAQGDYTTPIPEKGRGVLLQMAQNVNAATGGLKVAVEKELAGQRFKAELITNVSHDLRTPLTSVITYADLLQNEGLDAPDAEKYLDIIRQKAKRLQTLTEDLFEASKASSGETRAELAPLDVNQLIEQTLGEMGDRLSAAGLEVRDYGQSPETRRSLMVMADGRLLCRVFENLLRNIEKYALAGTRVYIDKAESNGNAFITLRNISAAPLSGLSGEEDRLSERFTRSDEARSTEGNGLGLAIVKSFMELQKGTCAIAVDGDLFKVVLTLPLA